MHVLPFYRLKLELRQHYQLQKATEQYGILMGLWVQRVVFYLFQMEITKAISTSNSKKRN